jgi:hypothetical protein
MSRVFFIPVCPPGFPNLEIADCCAVAKELEESLLTTATPPMTAADSILMMGCTFSVSN